MEQLIMYAVVRFNSFYLLSCVQRRWRNRENFIRS